MIARSYVREANASHVLQDPNRGSCDGLRDGDLPLDLEPLADDRSGV